MDWIKDKIGTLFRKFLVPSLLSAAAVSIFQLVDMIAIGQGVGSDGVAALSVVTPLFGITSFIGVFIGIGGSVPMGIALGERNTDKYRAYFTASLILVSLLTIIFWIPLLLFSDEIFTFFGASERLLPVVSEYGDLIIWGFPFFIFSIYLSCIVRADGAPNTAMWAVAAGGIFNVIADYLFVFPFKIGTGMAGASLATVLSNVVQVVIFIAYFFKGKGQLGFSKPFEWRTALKNILTRGFSTGFIDIAGNMRRIHKLRLSVCPCGRCGCNPWMVRKRSSFPGCFCPP